MKLQRNVAVHNVHVFVMFGKGIPGLDGEAPGTEEKVP